MMRNPEQRLISEYNMYGQKRGWSLREFAEKFGGGAVKQLTMNVNVIEGRPLVSLDTPTSAQVREAIDMLYDGFAFVGITEQWALSVCLFRVMFGGQCVASDFANVRPGENASSSYYDTSELFGWVDVWDGPLYAEAVLMFKSTLTVYGVDASSCSSMCQDQSDL